MSSSMIQTLAQLLQCNRRSPKARVTTPKTAHVKLQHAAAPKVRNRSDCSDLSTDVVSDHSGLTDSSSEMTEVLNSPKSDIAPPPGLDRYRASKFSRQAQQPARRTETRGNVGAVSHSSVRQRRALTSHGGDALVQLKEALDRLGPAEVAAVKSLLDSKATVDAPGGARRTRSGAERGMQRPCEPFDRLQIPNRPPKTRLAMPAEEQKTREFPDEPESSLRRNLTELASIDDARVLMVKKVKRLGMESGPLLEAHLKKFGTVEKVMVAPTLSQNKRLRPAGVGFVVMSTVEEAQAALKHAEAHIVDGKEIEVAPFASRSVDDTE